MKNQNFYNDMHLLSRPTRKLTLISIPFYGYNISINKIKGDTKGMENVLKWPKWPKSTRRWVPLCFFGGSLLFYGLIDRSSDAPVLRSSAALLGATSVSVEAASPSATDRVQRLLHDSLSQLNLDELGGWPGLFGNIIV